VLTAPKHGRIGTVPDPSIPVRGEHRPIRCACIDIGTNTTRLLVAERTEAGLRQVAVARAFVPLTGGEDPASTAAALGAAVSGQLDAAREHGAERVRVVGTAALRAAADPDVLCRIVREHAGTAVEVVSPQEEARLAFLGATGTLPAPPVGDVAVVDVGGGSTELAVGRGGGPVSWWASRPVGSAVLTDAHVHHDPPLPEELEALAAAAREALAGVAPPRSSAAYAVGGSAASIPRVVGPRITPEAAERALARLTEGPAEEVARARGLDARRVRLLPAGVVLLREAQALVGRPLEVARGGLREGVVLDTGSSQAGHGDVGH